jgi:3-oxoacyl-[acyl-carrier-protein] synthase I
MSVPPLAVLRTGLVTAVGLSSPAACAAIRARVTQTQQTRFIDQSGEWINASSVPLEEPWRGGHKLAAMASMAITECLSDTPRQDWSSIPLWLCVAEKSRPGRDPRVDDQLYLDIVQQLGARFAQDSAIVPHGRASVGTALFQARKLVYERHKPLVLIVGVDSVLNWSTLSAYERADRVLTSRNSNGFIPGEAAGAILVGRPSGRSELLCTGLGFGMEPATIDSQEPLRADGLVKAIEGALAEAGCGMHDIDWRICDVSGEQYYFKEAALALTRLLRERKESLDIWHAAECTGETGAAAGVIAVAVADAAGRKAYAPGPAALFHASNDSGERVAAVLTYGGR